MVFRPDSLRLLFTYVKELLWAYRKVGGKSFLRHLWLSTSAMDLKIFAISTKDTKNEKQSIIMRSFSQDFVFNSNNRT